MKIAVIGGAGYIGSHVARELLDFGHEVFVYDNLSSGLKQNLFEDANFTHSDILDVPELERFFEEAKPEGIVHLAALKAAGESMLSPEKYSVNNITGSLNILNAASKHSVKYIVFSSSAAVYGSPKYLPMDEKHPTEPENYYGYTKLAIEQFLQWYGKLKGIKYAALRYFNAAGYDIKGRISGLEQNPANLIPIVMEAAAGKRACVGVFGNDYETKDGTGVRDYIHVNDLARAHRMAFAQLQETGKSFVVNLGVNSGNSVLEVIKGAERISGKKINYRIEGRRPGDPAVVLADSAYAKEFLGWQAECSDLDTILRTTWRVYWGSDKKNGFPP
uniref:UDP-glucose 4-epimerase n=1 Tax=uncultured bacterium contig00103 TaxID=1181570 RepID=A0A806KI16_9BACT|nr:UDP-glucose 4-epimerase [uncultured bacterium contig00103]